MKTDTCSVCGKEIGSYKRTKGMCHRCYYKKLWKENPDKYQKRLESCRKYRRKLREKVFAHYGNCVFCGETRVEFLCADHKNNEGKVHRKEIGRGGSETYRWIIKNNFPNIFQTLCSFCNWGRGVYGKKYKSEMKKWAIRVLEREKQRGEYI